MGWHGWGSSGYGSALNQWLWGAFWVWIFTLEDSNFNLVPPKGLEPQTFEPAFWSINCCSTGTSSCLFTVCSQYTQELNLFSFFFLVFFFSGRCGEAVQLRMSRTFWKKSTMSVYRKMLRLVSWQWNKFPISIHVKVSPVGYCTVLYTIKLGYLYVCVRVNAAEH